MGVQRGWVFPDDLHHGPPANVIKDVIQHVVLAADHDREVAEAEARGWNAAIQAVLEYGLGDQEHDAIAALRKPEVAG